MQIKFKKLHPDAVIPARQSEGAAGYDIYSLEEVTIHSGETAFIKTGIAIELPECITTFLVPRSSLCIKKHLDMPHSLGIFDSDYRGEYLIVYRNIGTEPVTLEKHERIAQFIFVHYQSPELIEVKKLSETARGEGGFGSTGK